MTEANSTKVCRDCHRDLPLDQFHKNAECRNGLRPECRSCVKVYRRKYYLAQQERLCEYSKSYYLLNREQSLAATRRYEAQNKERMIAYRRQWRAENRERLLTGKRQHYLANKGWYNQRGRENRLANKERYAVYYKEYALANPDVVRFNKLQHQIRKRNAAGLCTSKQWREKCEYHGWRCIYCRTTVTPKNVTIEHRKPLSKGGSNWPANLGPCCRSCNQSKNKKTEQEFREYLTKLNHFPSIANLVDRCPRSHRIAAE